MDGRRSPSSLFSFGCEQADRLLRFDRLNHAGKFGVEWPRQKPVIVAFVEGDENICPRERLAR